jgi:hypothetical protein
MVPSPYKPSAADPSGADKLRLTSPGRRKHHSRNEGAVAPVRHLLGAPAKAVPETDLTCTGRRS